MSEKYFNLENPLSISLNKPKQDFTRTDIMKAVRLHNIERITFHYTGLDSKFKELKIPVANEYQLERILADGERVDGSSLFKGMVDSSLSDLYVVPLYKTAFINPFDNKSIDMTCRYFDKTGQLAGFTLDNVLGSAYRLFKERTGCELYALGELEFFLIGDNKNNLFPADKQKSYHLSSPFLKNGQILDEMVRTITQLTGCVKYAHSEVGFIDNIRSNIDEIKNKFAEQMEIEFLPAPIDDAGDYLMLSRWLIRNIAYKYNCIATFTPKIEEGVAGNGFHVHMALMKNNKNIMTDEKGHLSDNAKKIIGGLCKYAESLTAFGNTVSSAYLRLVPNQEAPTKICWSDLNRSAMIRVPLGWSGINNLANIINKNEINNFDEIEGRQTVELRSPDGSAIVYLLLAGLTMAAGWGLTHEESLELTKNQYVQGNIFKNEKLLHNLSSLPTSCVESAKLLLQMRNLYERDGVFPPSIIDYTAKMLMSENDEKMNEKLVDLPADDRLYETRKIMHKDLHKH
jgi:glutamine synthetase